MFIIDSLYKSKQQLLNGDAYYFFAKNLGKVIIYTLI